ncbi:MAG: class I SAM-dependent methyltransferase, partial [Anaerolineales bacterium]|nr:class I SAM-dependent methyltransferase [Anaerolineales bacterium]
GLSAVSVWVATFGKIVPGAAQMTLFDVKDHLLRQVELDSAAFKNNAWQEFVFDPIPGSQGQVYCFQFETTADPATPLTLLTNTALEGYTQKNATPLPETICFECLYATPGGSLYSREANSAFRQALDEYMQSFAGSFAYQDIILSHLDVSRFYPILQAAGAYKPLPGSIVLSSGCGSGGDLFVCLDLGAERVFGIEVNEGLLKMARARFQGSAWEGKADLQRYHGRSLPYPDQTFDLIVSLHVIEHTQDNELYLRELLRVLRPGGVLFLDVPNRFYSHELHTGIPLINLPPTWLRDRLIDLLLSPLLSWVLRISSSPIAHTREKLSVIRGLQLPSAGWLLKIFKAYQAAYSLELLDAFFHSYGEQRIPYPSDDRSVPVCQYLAAKRRRLSTFRLVVGRTS